MSGALATRYAAALADVALEQKNGAAVRRDLASFAEAFFVSDDLRNFLQSPGISAVAKRRAIEEIAARMGMTESVRNFVYLVVDHHRTEMLREIQQAFREELNARLGIAEAEITSAGKLNEAERNELISALERRTGKKIEARFNEDKTLLSGARVRVGSTSYDGSVREHLNRLREQLEAE